MILSASLVWVLITMTGGGEVRETQHVSEMFCNEAKYAKCVHVKKDDANGR